MRFLLWKQKYGGSCYESKGMRVPDVSVLALPNLEKNREWVILGGKWRRGS